MKQNIEKQDIILRDKLALDRTILANQRTLLSFTRTGLYFITTAIGLYYLEKKINFGFFEWALTIIGFAAIITGMWSYFKVKSKIKKLYP